jgi:hypothetical protein
LPRSSRRKSNAKGVDAARLDEKEKARLRGQALAWLRADLVVLAKSKDESGRLWSILDICLFRPEFSCVRDELSLAKPPEAERQAWQKLWADVAAVAHGSGAPQK